MFPNILRQKTSSDTPSKTPDDSTTTSNKKERWNVAELMHPDLLNCARVVRNVMYAISFGVFWVRRVSFLMYYFKILFLFQ